jgi:hypothetical protein
LNHPKLALQYLSQNPPDRDAFDHVTQCLRFSKNPISIELGAKLEEYSTYCKTVESEQENLLDCTLQHVTSSMNLNLYEQNALKTLNYEDLLFLSVDEIRRITPSMVIKSIYQETISTLNSTDLQEAVSVAPCFLYFLSSLLGINTKNLLKTNFLKSELSDFQFVYERVKDFAFPFFDQYYNAAPTEKQKSKALQEKGPFFSSVAQLLFKICVISRFMEIRDTHIKRESQCTHEIDLEKIPSDSEILEYVGYRSQGVTCLMSSGIIEDWCYSNLGKKARIKLPDFQECVEMTEYLSLTNRFHRQLTLHPKINTGTNFVITKDLVRKIDEIWLKGKTDDCIWITAESDKVKDLEFMQGRTVIKVSSADSLKSCLDVLKPTKAVILGLKPGQDDVTFTLRSFGVEYLLVGGFQDGNFWKTWGKLPLFAPRGFSNQSPLLGWRYSMVPEISEYVRVPEDTEILKFNGAFAFQKEAGRALLGESAGGGAASLSTRSGNMLVR